MTVKRINELKHRETQTNRVVKRKKNETNTVLRIFQVGRNYKFIKPRILIKLKHKNVEENLPR